MTSIEGKIITNKEVQERCGDWVKSQKELLYSEDNMLKRKLDDELDEFVDTDSEFDSVSECGAKKRRIAKQMKEEILHLPCEWKECLFHSNSMEIFMKHVANHIPQLDTRIVDKDKEVYVCKWKNCSYEIDCPYEIARHVNYHAYHSKLKCIGSNIKGRIKLPKCYRDPRWKNVIELPPAHVCQWEVCSKTYNNYQLYLYHMTAHIESNPRGNKVEGGVKCRWAGCRGIYPSLYKLRDHMRHHTKEKLVACPDCGATFAANTKFHDHCRRQIPLEVQGFQCSHCNKFYPTENILREHMRLHVFNYKCNMCEMSCESPASLAKHIRYRHVSTRPFPCQLCSHAAKSQQDLDSHMTVHTNGPNFVCNFDGCSYKCKGAYILDRHVERVHSQEVRWYCCHECPIKYRKSYRLTKHLIDGHHLQWPNGHKRFQYVQDEDGYYRLQMVRYESVDEENISPAEEVVLPDKKYNITMNLSSTIPNIEISANEEEANPSSSTTTTETQNNVGKSMPIISNILISIDEMDADGNIVQRNFVQTQETNELPPSEEPPIILN